MGDHYRLILEATNSRGEPLPNHRKWWAFMRLDAKLRDEAYRKAFREGLRLCVEDLADKACVEGP